MLCFVFLIWINKKIIIFFTVISKYRWYNKIEVDNKAEIRIITKHVPAIGNFTFFDKLISKNHPKNSKLNIIKKGIKIIKKPYLDFKFIVVFLIKMLANLNAKACNQCQ